MKQTYFSEYETVLYDTNNITHDITHAQTFHKRPSFMNENDNLYKYIQIPYNTEIRKLKLNKLKNYTTKEKLIISNL